MKIAVIGGKLQGIEILYLAQKAGYQTLLIDKNLDCTAVKLCDQFLQFKFSNQQPIPPNCPKVDYIFPAIEDDEVLSALALWAETAGIPLLFDAQAYRISSSKIVSNNLFKNLDLAAPKNWPDCDLPVVIKPDGASGSRGVQVVKDQQSLQSYLANNQDSHDLVIQEYISGPSYSIEIIGRPGTYLPLQVTGLHMDSDYDCKRVTSPADLSNKQEETFADMARRLAEAVQLRGIMDVEVVLHDNILKLLEIDARFPSQTPMAVYWSTGINMVTLLCEPPQELQLCHVSQKAPPLSVSVEHIRVKDGSLRVCGEHIMGSDTPLILRQDFWGATEALTSFQPGKNEWVATMIFTGNSAKEIAAKRDRCYNLVEQKNQTI